MGGGGEDGGRGSTFVLLVLLGLGGGRSCDGDLCCSSSIFALTAGDLHGEAAHFAAALALYTARCFAFGCCFGLCFGLAFAVVCISFGGGSLCTSVACSLLLASLLALLCSAVGGSGGPRSSLATILLEALPCDSVTSSSCGGWGWSFFFANLFALICSNTSWASCSARSCLHGAVPHAFAMMFSCSRQSSRWPNPRN